MQFNRNKIKIENIKTWGIQDILRYLSAYGALAPSAHNVQPWKFKIDNNSIEVIADHTRRLPHSDSEDRQFWISIGAAVGSVKIAAEAYNIQYRTVETKMIFDISEISPPNEVILNSLLKRHSHRLPFKVKELAEEDLLKLSSSKFDEIKIGLYQDNTKQQVKKIVGESASTAFKNKNFRYELAQWIKPSLAKYEDGMPGYVLPVPKLFSFFLPYLIKYFDLGNMQKKMHEDWIENAPAYGLISAIDSKANWIKSGEVLVRLWVLAESLGLRIGIMGAPIETIGYAEELRSLLNMEYRPQVFFRIGYASPAPYTSPRIDLKNTIL